MFWLVSLSSFLLISYVPLRYAMAETRQDAWISMLLGGFIMTVVTWVVLRVCKRHGEQTFVGFAKALMGTVLGKFVAAVYFVLWFAQMATIAKDMADFQNLVMLHRTPMSVIVACMFFLVAYAVYRGGITTVSRCAEVIGPIFISFLVLQLFLVPQNMQFSRILPVFADSGWRPVFRGALNCFPFLGDPTIVLMLYYFASDKRTASRAILWGTGIASAWGVLLALVLLFVTGPNLALELAYPVYALTKYVTILNFVQNIDAVFIPLWLLGAFIKLSVSMFILSYGFSEWTGIRNWKAIAWTASALLLAYVVYCTYHLRLGFALREPAQIRYVYPIVYAGFPLLLWMISAVKRQRKPARAE